jgi:hypothetical protein
MPAGEARIVQAARAWALALAAVQEITDQSEAELAIHGVAERAQAFKEAEEALYQAIQQATAHRHTLDACEVHTGVKSTSPSTMLTVSPSSDSDSSRPSQT